MEQAIQPLLSQPGGLLPPGWVHPHYAGWGFANIPATVGALLGTQVGTLPPLAPALWEPLAAGVERVVVLLIDALGWELLARTDPAFLEGWHQAGGIAAPITSICPSTTAAATTTLWTGEAPAAHGFTGYMQYLPEMGAVCDMIFFRGALSQRTGELVEWGLDPLSLTPVPGVGEWLAQARIPTIALSHERIIESPLSSVHYRGPVRRLAHSGTSDFWLRLREAVESTAGRRAYLAAYWSQVDSLAHAFGPDDPTWPTEWRSLRYFLEQEFLGRLSPEARRGTLLIVTADHGQVANDPDEFLLLTQHPELQAMLRTLPAGDPRQLYLWPRPGMTAAVRDYVGERLPGFLLFDRDALLEAGLYGPTVWPETRARMGELVLFSTGRQMLFWRQPHTIFRGMHGGLLRDEALVPWLARRLD